MRLLLIRHGLTDWVGMRLPGRLPGIHLNGEGRAQAAALALRLAAVPLDAVYSSPLERALETAQPLAAAHGLAIEVREDLGEVDCGEWTGRDLEDVRNEALWPVLRSFPSAARFPGGESLREARDRVVAALDSIREAHEGHTVAVVSHADPIRLAAAHYAGMSLDLFQRLVISPASVTAFEILGLGPRVICLNHAESLPSILLSDRHAPGSAPGPVV